MSRTNVWRRCHGRSRCGRAVLGGLSVLVAGATSHAAPEGEQRPVVETLVTAGKVTRIDATYRPWMSTGTSPGIVDRGPNCPITSESRHREPRAGHPEDLDFNNIVAGQQIVVQAGFSEGEIAAQSYQINNLQFPIKIDLIQAVIGSVAMQETTTRYTIMLWDGTPATGTLLYSASSDNLGEGSPPDLVLPPRPAGSGTPPPAAIGDLQFSIDNGGDPSFDWRIDPIPPDQPDDPFPNVPHTITIGIRIDQHNNQTSNPCLIAPSQASNAFPCTEPATCCMTSLLTFPDENWLYGLNCGSGGCPANGGYATFANLASSTCLGGLGCAGCRPSGDWALRLQWSSLGCLPPGTGACCAASGTCQTTSQANCAGTYQGDNSSCSPNPCPQPTGACCKDGVCTVATQSACIASSGTYQGNSVVCASVTCPQPTGACCFSPSSCQVLDAATCSGFGGTYAGNGTACAAGACPTGACCLPSGACVAAQLASQCVSQGGTLQAVGSACSPNPCPQPTGACCNNANGFCSMQTQAFCAGIPNTTWQGPGGSCSPNPCGGTGACCCGSSCTLTLAANCTGANRAFTGAGTACNAPGNIAAPCCRADFNRTGDVSVQDVFDFLGAFFSNDPCADLANDGVTIQDVFDFLGAFFAGPC